MKTIYLTDDDEDDRALVRMAINEQIQKVRIVELGSGEDLIEVLRKKNRPMRPPLSLST